MKMNDKMAKELQNVLKDDHGIELVYSKGAEMAEEKTTAGGQTMSDYWKDAWQKASNRELAAKELANKHARRANLTLTELQAMKAEKARWKKEALNLRAKLAEVENRIDDGYERDDEEYEKDDDGRYRAENDFDARDHYTEM